MTKKKEVEKRLVLKKPRISKPMPIRIGGKDIILHRFGGKSKLDILTKQLKKGLVAVRSVRDPKEEFEQSLYIVTPGKFKFKNDGIQDEFCREFYKKNDIGIGEVKFDGSVGFPVSGIRKSILTATTDLGFNVSKAFLNRNLRISGTHQTMTEIKYKKMFMREDVVRLGGQGRSFDLRFRPMMTDWSMEIVVQFDRDLLGMETILNLLIRAGFSVGLGDWRPECSGNFGRYVLKK